MKRKEYFEAQQTESSRPPTNLGDLLDTDRVDKLFARQTRTELLGFEPSREAVGGMFLIPLLQAALEGDRDSRQALAGIEGGMELLQELTERLQGLPLPGLDQAVSALEQIDMELLFEQVDSEPAEIVSAPTSLEQGHAGRR